MNDENLDERYSVADEAIYDAFFLILKEKEYDKITVSDIIKRAGIVRSTFYNHYENIPDLVNIIEDKTIQDIFSIMETFHPKNDWDLCHSYFLTICNYNKTNPLLASIIRSPRGDRFLEKAITMFHNYTQNAMESNSSSEQGKQEFSYMIASAIGCTIGVLHKWAAEDFQLPAEEVADILTRIFMTGILPML